MWSPEGVIEELNLDLEFPKDVNIAVNFLKIRKTNTRSYLPDISNVKLTNKDEISKFKTAKRCEEHAAGRHLLHQMLVKYYPHLDHTCLEVIRDENRAPTLKWINGTFNSKPLPNFSISTSGAIAIVALSNPEFVVGIDIEKSNEKRSKNLFEFLSNGPELEKITGIKGPNINYKINQLWTVKESLLKSLRLGMSISPTKIKVLEKNSEFKHIIDYDNIKLNLKTSILKFDEKYCFAIAYRATMGHEFETLNTSELEFKKYISSNVEQGKYNFNMGCGTN